jgi:hypothetical protein
MAIKFKYMKKILALLLFSGLLLSCKPGNEKEKNAEPAVAESHQEHSEKAGELELNHGSKWKVDSATLSNAGSLKSIVAGAKTGSLETYKQTATDLQGGLNKMIAECKMKGPDHEALHHWLEPLMEETKALKNATSVDKAASLLKEIELQVNLFDQYFELS